MTDASTGAPYPAQRWITILDGGRLRQIRRQHGLSQAELAGQAGISLATVGRQAGREERKHHPPCRSRTLARLAAALHTEPATLTPATTAPGHEQPSHATSPDTT